MNYWAQGATVGAMVGGIAFVANYSIGKWVTPRLPARAAGLRSRLDTIGGCVIGNLVGIACGWLPLWSLLPISGGAAAGTLLSDAVRKARSADTDA